MSDRLRLTTDDQRQWLAQAKEYGGRCAGCGRGVHYSPDLHQRGNERKQALCSRRCGSRAYLAKQRKRAEGERSTR
jgi:hypothetical protein